MWREHRWDSNAFICLSLFVRESRPSLNAGGLPPPTFNTATFRVGVLAVGMRIRVRLWSSGSRLLSCRAHQGDHLSTLSHLVTFAVGYVVELARDDPVWQTLRCVPSLRHEYL